MSYTLEIGIEEAEQLFRQVLKVDYLGCIVQIKMLQDRPELDPVQVEELMTLVELASAMEVLIRQYFAEHEYVDIIV